MKEKIEKIIKIEYEMFNQIQNVAKYSCCNNDVKTFSIMRRSQFYAWSYDMICYYLKHCKDAFNIGRNLMAEKYGHMMEYTHKEEYKRIQHMLHKPNENSLISCEIITKVMTEWGIEVKELYPNISLKARVLEASCDTLQNTSTETYLRGELYTYSPEVLMLFHRYVIKLQSKNQNMVKMIFNNIMHYYGFKDLSDAENYFEKIKTNNLRND